MTSTPALLPPAPDRCDAPWVDDPVPQLAPGRPGKDGFLDLRLVRDTSLGRTVARGITHRPPFQIGRILYPDSGIPDMAYCYVAMLTGGLVQGDRLRLQVALDSGARAHVTTLAATKIYRMERNGAEQRVSLEVGPGAVLEWWPDPLIPFRGARLWQEVDITVDPTGILLYADLLHPGRETRGECHDYDYYRSRVTVRRPGGATLFVDTQAFAPPPPSGARLSETLPPGQQSIGTVYAAVALSAVPSLLHALREWCTTSDPAVVLAGCSALPGDSGVVVRFLAGASDARRALDELLALLRRQLLAAPPPPHRRP